jgi:small multidrug resistance pump
MKPEYMTPFRSEAPNWMRAWLYFAGIYNLLWGAVVVLAPLWLFKVLNVPQDMWPNVVGTSIWQCVGMIVGVYGIGYIAAARDPLRHWPIILVGLLGKIFGPIGFVDAALIKGVFPIEFGWTILTNDLLWWVPFSMILYRAWSTRQTRR